MTVNPVWSKIFFLFYFFLSRKHRWTFLSSCHPKKETVVDLIRARSLLPCTESGWWANLRCTVTKATRRWKSSTENVKVICIFTFVWGVGSAPRSPLFYICEHAAVEHASPPELMGWRITQRNVMRQQPCWGVKVVSLVGQSGFPSWLFNYSKLIKI